MLRMRIFLELDRTGFSARNGVHSLTYVIAHR